jgi:hypothetical protein
MIASSGFAVTPANLDWPLHHSLTQLRAPAALELAYQLGDLEIRDDLEIGQRSLLADSSFSAATEQGLLVPQGTGLLARWIVNEDLIANYRRALLGAPLTLVLALRQAGKRWATLSDTVLKNLDTAAASWAPTYVGESSDPMDRQPLLRAVL